LTFTERFVLLHQIAMGMNWLHSSDPIIIHHDLKPSNILLDLKTPTPTPKICDFGLSVLKRGGQSLRHKAGTKLWSAPEVLLDQEHDEKVDVYSYAIIMWQCANKQTELPTFPYQEYIEMKDIHLFYNDVCLRKVRPDTESIPEPARILLEQMWNHKPAKRPKFRQIIEDIPRIIAECAIKSNSGREFWNSYFDKAIVVEFTLFLNKLKEWINEPDSAHYTDYSNAQKENGLLRMIFTGDAEGEKVQIDRFGLVLEWFGPIREGDSILTHRMLSILQKQWFQGDMNGEEANDLLKKEKKKIFSNSFIIT